MIFRQKLLIFVFSSIILSACTASSPDIQQSASRDVNIQALDKWIEQVHIDEEFNGVALIARKGKVLWKTSKGFKSVKKKENLNLDSSFNLASVSKQFTATGILLLVQDKKINLDAPVNNYLKNFPYNDISIRHLLTHTSGVASYIKLANRNWDESKPLTNQDVIDLLIKNSPKLKFNPGDKFDYSNTGYVLLAAIIESVTGNSFELFMQENIFSPLKMSNSRVLNLLSKNAKFDNRVYGFDGSKENDLIYLDGVTGDGAVYASANDLIMWDRAIYSNQLLSKELQELAFTPFKLNSGEMSNYGFGWGISEDKNVASHSGSWVGFRTYIRRDMKNETVIIVLTNSSQEKHMREIILSLRKVFVDS